MKNVLKPIVLLAFLSVFATGCATTNYSARSGYVGFSDNGVVSVQQMKKTEFDDEALYETYDDEFVYDEDGDVLKHIQTSYFDKGEKFDEWIVEYQKIGGTSLPSTVSINGIVYMEAEYEILNSEHEGLITPTTSSPRFSQGGNTNILMTLFLGAKTPQIDWKIDLDHFDVPFRTDDKFVTTEEKFGYYTGLSMDKILTLGYDNIVLKRFYYSPSKFEQGYELSLEDNMDEIEEILDEESKNVTFLFNWKVIADKIIQTDMTLTEYYRDGYLKFYSEKEYDESGRRINEIWKLNDSKKYIENPLTLFTQTLTF